MNSKRKLVAGSLSGLAMLVIILDTRCAVDSAKESIELCLRTVVPSLFPFFVLSSVLSSCLIGRTIPILRPFGRLCHVPKGGESLLLLGFITGYPVGAQMIAQAYKDKALPIGIAHRMLGFCSNAGPAFIFGMLSPLFADKYVPWLLWGIHITSGIAVGFILPAQERTNCVIKETSPLSPGKALRSALSSLATVCGWVILFRIMLGYFDRWFLWRLSLPAQVILSGTLELTNGCAMLKLLSSEGMKFIVASGILAFGGLCVGIQTQAVTQGLGTGYYFPGKILHALFSILLSAFVQRLIFHSPEIYFIRPSAICFMLFSVILILFLFYRKKVVAIGRNMLYNTRDNSKKGATLCYFERK